MFSKKVIKEHCSDSDSSDSDYKSLIPKCNDKFCIGKKKKNWKKIFTNNLVINSYNFFVKNINNIFVIGFTPPDSDNFYPLHTVAYGNGLWNGEPYTVPQNNYLSFSTVGYTYNMKIYPAPNNVQGDCFQILIPGSYMFSFSCTLGGSTSEGYFEITITNGTTTTSTNYDFHTEYGTDTGVIYFTISGSAILSLKQNDLIGLKQLGPNSVGISGQTTTVSCVFLGPSIL
jgi:hypothetical protein